jgi:hypothetical protein
MPAQPTINAQLMDRTLVDPWSGDLLTAAQAAERCRERAQLAEGFSYRLRRLIKGWRTGYWEPLAATLYERADWVESL